MGHSLRFPGGATSFFCLRVTPCFFPRVTPYFFHLGTPYFFSGGNPPVTTHGHFPPLNSRVTSSHIWAGGFKDWQKNLADDVIDTRFQPGTASGGEPAGVDALATPVSEQCDQEMFDDLFGSDGEQRETREDKKTKATESSVTSICDTLRQRKRTCRRHANPDQSHDDSESLAEESVSEDDAEGERRLLEDAEWVRALGAALDDLEVEEPGAESLEGEFDFQDEADIADELGYVEDDFGVDVDMISGGEEDISDAESHDSCQLGGEAAEAAAAAEPANDGVDQQTELPRVRNRKKGPERRSTVAAHIRRRSVKGRNWLGEKCKGAGCVFHFSNAGQAARVEHGHVYCCFCDANRFKSLHSSNKMHITSMLKKLSKHDKKFVDHAIRNIENFVGDTPTGSTSWTEVAAEFKKRMLRPPRLKREGLSSMKQKWTKLLQKRERAAGPLKTKKRKAYKETVMKDRSSVRRKIFFPDKKRCKAACPADTVQINSFTMVHNHLGCPPPAAAVYYL